MVWTIRASITLQGLVFAVAKCFARVGFAPLRRFSPGAAPTVVRLSHVFQPVLVVVPVALAALIARAIAMVSPGVLGRVNIHHAARAI